MVEYVYETPTASPMESQSWKGLQHQDGDELIDSLDELKKVFSSDALADFDNRLALWSFLLGYCEAISTHKERRYDVYPIPIAALRRVVTNEFVTPSANTHRSAAQAVSNWIWTKVVPKSNSKDELHANSLYSVLRGKVEGKSLDCFGAALCTVIGLRQIGYCSSVLTLSEDHAYESHCVDGDSTIYTCEVAIPGNTNDQKSKRGRETSATFHGKTTSSSPDSSWLYMASCPVYCRSGPMIVAAALANVNPRIDGKVKRGIEVYNVPLWIIKRDLLWILKDAGHLDSFPFALCELGWSEEHCTSPRGEAMISSPELNSRLSTGVEALYLEAITCSRSQYNDRQVYPYCYIGFYHKDAGQDDEGLLAVALRYFCDAARVASGYTYEWGDTLQLLKTMTKLSEFIVSEILSDDDVPRNWNTEDNAVLCGHLLVTFFDYLFLWEERSNEQFLPILKPSHKASISKAFALLSVSIRIEVLRGGKVNVLSKRFVGSLREALQAPKISLSDMHLTIVSESRGSRKRKATKT